MSSISPSGFFPKTNHGVDASLGSYPIVPDNPLGYSLDSEEDEAMWFFPNHGLSDQAGLATGGAAGSKKADGLNFSKTNYGLDASLGSYSIVPDNPLGYSFDLEDDEGMGVGLISSPPIVSSVMTPIENLLLDDYLGYDASTTRTGDLLERCIKTQVGRLGLGKAYKDFSASLMSSETPFAKTLKKGPLLLDATGESVGGKKRKRSDLVPTKNPQLFDIPQVRLYVHALGDRYLASTPEAQNFDRVVFLETFIEIIKECPEIDSFNKEEYVHAICGMLEYQKKLSDCELSQESIHDRFIKLVLDAQLKADLFKTTLNERNLKARLSLAPIPPISANFLGEFAEWKRGFFKECPLKETDASRHFDQYLVLEFIQCLYFRYIENLNLYCEEIEKDITELSIGKSLFLPSGFGGVFNGHFCIVVITKQKEGEYSLKIYNTGRGTQAHHRIIDQGKLYIQTFIEFVNVPETILLQKDAEGYYSVLIGFFEYINPISILFQQKTKKTPIEDIFYDDLLICLQPYLNPLVGEEPFYRPQKTGTCVYRGVKALIPYFCEKEVSDKEVIREIKKVIFHKAFLSLVEKYHQISDVQPIEWELVLRCTQKFSDQIYHEIKQPSFDLSKGADMISDIHEAVCFIHRCQKKQVGSEAGSIASWTDFKNKIEEKEITDFIEAIAPPDWSLEKQPYIKFQDSFDFLKNSSMSLEEKFQKLVKLQNEKDALLTISLPDVWDLFNQFSLNDEDLLEGVLDSDRFLDDLIKISRKIIAECSLKSCDKKNNSLVIAFFGKAYLLAHKVCMGSYPDLLKDLPISFGGYEVDGYLEGLNFNTPYSGYVSAYIVDCKKYVDSFNESLEKKGFLFADVLRGEICLDTTFENPAGERFIPDFLLYKRLLENDPKFKEQVLKDDPRQLIINAIGNFYSIEKTIETGEFKEPNAVFAIKELKVFFDAFLETYRQNLEEESLFNRTQELMIPRFNLDQHQNKLKYSIKEGLSLPRTGSSLSIMDIITDRTKGKKDLDDLIIDPEERWLLYELVDFAKDRKNRWLTLIDILADPEKLSLLKKYNQELEYALFSSLPTDDTYLQLLDAIKNPHFQSILINCLINSCYQLSADPSGLKLTIVLIDLIAKIMPHINQGYIDFSKLNAIVKSIPTVSYSKELKAYLDNETSTFLANIDLSLASTYDRSLTKNILIFFVNKLMYLYRSQTLTITHLDFFHFFKKNAEYFNADLELAKIAYHEICSIFELRPYVLEKIEVDEKKHHIQFKIKEAVSALYIDKLFRPFVKDKDKYISAKCALYQPQYADFFKKGKLPYAMKDDGNIVFEYGIYENKTDLFRPSDRFERNLPDEFKDKKWMFRSIFIDEVYEEGCKLVTEILYPIAGESVSAILLDQEKDSLSYFIALDKDHNPLVTIKIEAGVFMVFDCVKKLERLIPSEAHYLGQLFCTDRLSFFKQEKGFDVRLESKILGSQELVCEFPSKSSLVPFVYLKDNPDYVLTENIFPFPHLAFKHAKDSSQPDCIFFSPKHAGYNKAWEFGDILKVSIKNNELFSDALDALLYITYMHFEHQNYDQVKRILYKLNHRNKQLYKILTHEKNMALTILNYLTYAYKKYALDASVRRYFILTIVAYFDLIIKKDQIKAIIEDYITDTKKHIKLTLPDQVLKWLPKRLEIKESVWNLDKQPQVAYRSSLEGETSTRDFKNLMNEPDFFKTADFDPQVDFFKGFSKQSTVLELLKEIKSKDDSNEKILRSFLGSFKPRHLIIKALVREKKILASLDVIKDSEKLETVESAYRKQLVEKFEDLIPYFNKELRYPSLPIITAKSYEKKRLDLLTTSAASTALIPLSELNKNEWVKDVITYHRFLLIFIKAKLSSIPTADFSSQGLPIVENLITFIEHFSKVLETRILKGCEGHLNGSVSGDNRMLWIPRYVQEYEKLSFDDLLEPYIKETTQAYQETLKGHGIAPVIGRLANEKDFYQSLDMQISFCMYLKSLNVNLGKIKKSLLDNKISQTQLVDLPGFTDTFIATPRNQLVFEYRFGHSLSFKQKEIIDFLSNPAVNPSRFKLAQVIMGGGKSSVIVPLLSRIFSEKQSTLLITPQTQLGSVLTYLDKTLSTVFLQEVEHLDFRSSKMSKEGYNEIYAKLIESSLKKILFVSSPESMQFLQLEFLKLIGEGGRKSKADLDKIDIIGKILNHFYSKTTVVIDEFSHVADITKQTHIPLLKQQKEGFVLPKSYLAFSEDLFVSMTEIFKEGIKKWDDNLEQIIDVFISKTSIQSYKTAVDNIAWEKVCTEIKAFLIDKENETFLTDENLAFIKYLLHFVVPHTLQKTRGRHYGRSFDQQSIGKVVPYQGVSSPASTEFGQYYEAVCYYYLTCIHSCYSKQEVCFLIDTLYEKAQKNAVLYKCEITATHEGVLFQNMFGFSIANAKIEEFLNKAYDQVCLFYKENTFEPLLKLESIFVDRYVKLRNIYLSSNVHNLIDQFSTVVGFTGTPWNKECYNICFKDAQKFDLEIEKSIDALFVKKQEENGSSLILHQTLKDPKIILASLLKYPDFSKISSFIDVGGAFSNFKNKEVAELIAQFYLEQKPTISQFHVIYFDRSTESLTLDTPYVLTANRAVSGCSLNTKILNGLKEQDLIAAGVVLDQYFVYFDERHTVGTDIPLPKDAIGLITVDKHLSHHAFLQGLMRLRQYKDQQNAMVINFDEKLTGILEHADFLDYLKKQEKQTLNPLVYRSFKQQIHAVFRKYAIIEILKSLGKDFSFGTVSGVSYSSLYEKYKEIFITTESIEPASLLKEVVDLKNPIASLTEYADALVKSTNIRSNKTIEDLLKIAESYFKDITLKTDLLSHTEVSLEEETEKEVEADVEKEIETELQTEIEKVLGSLKQSADEEIQFPIKEVLDFFKTSTKEFELGSLSIKPLGSFLDEEDLRDDILSSSDYQEAFDLKVSSNLLNAKDGGYIDIRDPYKKRICSLLAIIHQKRSKATISFTEEVIFIGLTEKETQTALEYLLKEKKTCAVLVSLDREILTPSLEYELKVKEKLLEVPMDFIETHAYNGHAHRLLPLAKQTFEWISDEDLGDRRKRFLQFQGSVRNLQAHKILLDRCLEQEFVCSAFQKDQILKKLLKKMSGVGISKSVSIDFVSNVTDLIQSLSIEHLKMIPLLLMPYVPLHLIPHFTDEKQLKHLNASQLKVATGGQKALLKLEETSLVSAASSSYLDDID